MNTVDLRSAMLQHLQASELTQQKVAQHEAAAGEAAKYHWPLQQKLLQDNPEYRQLVGKRNYHQQMVHLYSAALVGLGAAEQLRWRPGAVPPNTSTAVASWPLRQPDGSDPA